MLTNTWNKSVKRFSTFSKISLFALTVADNNRPRVLTYLSRIILPLEKLPNRSHTWILSSSSQENYLQYDMTLNNRRVAAFYVYSLKVTKVLHVSTPEKNVDNIFQTPKSYLHDVISSFCAPHDGITQSQIEMPLTAHCWKECRVQAYADKLGRLPRSNVKFETPLFCCKFA